MLFRRRYVPRYVRSAVGLRFRACPRDVIIECKVNWRDPSGRPPQLANRISSLPVIIKVVRTYRSHVAPFARSDGIEIKLAAAWWFYAATFQRLSTISRISLEANVVLASKASKSSLANVKFDQTSKRILANPCERISREGMQTEKQR